MTITPVDPFPALSVALLGKEGRYCNDPADAGGETMWGITAFVARAFGYTAAMKDMPRDTALAIYRQRYWADPGFDKMYAVDPVIASRLFDIGVNMGQTIGIRFLQRALNALNQSAADYPDLKVDGALGAMTFAAVAAFFKKRGEPGKKVLRGMISAQHSVRYIEIAEAKPINERFEYGWQSQRATLAG